MVRMPAHYPKLRPGKKRKGNKTSFTGTKKRKYPLPKEGDTFGFWVVISPSFMDTGKNNMRRVEVRCICGKTKLQYESNLTRGLSKSCGCKQNNNEAAERSAKVRAVLKRWKEFQIKDFSLGRDA